jgi:multidrug resistance protein, MATE family
MGPQGSPFAVGLSFLLISILLVLYVRYIEGGECWGGWEWSEALNLNKIWVFLKLGTPGVLMTCSEW